MHVLYLYRSMEKYKFRTHCPIYVIADSIFVFENVDLFWIVILFVFLSSDMYIYVCVYSACSRS